MERLSSTSGLVIVQKKEWGEIFAYIDIEFGHNVELISVAAAIFY